MSPIADFSFVVPSASLTDAIQLYWLPLFLGAVWSALSLGEGRVQQKRLRVDNSIWWSLPLLVWSLQAAVYNIEAFEVLVESYSRALFISVLMEANAAAVALGLVLIVQLPGVLAAPRLDHRGRAPKAIIGVASGILAVILGYLLSIAVASIPLLEVMTPQTTGIG